MLKAFKIFLSFICAVLGGTGLAFALPIVISLLIIIIGSLLTVQFAFAATLVQAIVVLLFVVLSGLISGKISYVLLKGRSQNTLIVFYTMVLMTVGAIYSVFGSMQFMKFVGVLIS